MEGTVPPSESHVWSLNDFVERRKDWDQEDETRLAEYLQRLSNKINQGAKNTLNELNELLASVDDTVVKVANINNEFQLLADKQFIENKVQEEDETVHTSIKEPVVPKISDADSVVNNLKEILTNSFKAIDAHFERVTVIVSDSDDDDDESKHEETVLRPRTFYKKLYLPSLSGHTEPDIVLDCTMSSETDSEVEDHTNKYKDEESLSIDDIPTKNMHSTNESKIIHDSKPVVTHNNMFGSEKLSATNSPLNVDNAEVDLFGPPPLPNDNDDGDSDNEYNIFGNSNSNVYGENNFWDDNDDDEDLSNQPPLPIHFDEPPQPFVKPQEKVEVPSIQQSLNDELRKRFQKDKISLPSDNVNIESSKIKLLKGAVNDGTNAKPYIPTPAQNIKKLIPPDMNKPLTKTKHNSSVDATDYNISDKLLGNSSLNPPISARNENAVDETKPVKKRSFFEQDSDDEDLFSEKTPRVPVPASEIPIQNNDLGESAKLSKTMFLESDSDEDFLSSKSKNNKLSIHPNVDDNTNKFLDSSSDDDLFSNKSILKKKSIMAPSNVQVKEFTGKNKTINDTKQNSKSSVEKNDVMNKEVIDELKRKSINLSVSEKKSVIKEDSSPSKTIFNSSNTKSSSVDNRAQQSDEKSSNSQHTKSFSNLFSSDEDDLNDSKFSYNNESIKKRVNEDESVSTNSVKNGSSENCASKMDIFDSSSDDDIFSVIKVSKNVNSSKTIEKSVSNEIKNIEPTTNVFNQVQISENVAEISIKNASNQKITNLFSSLSDDEDDDLSVKKIPNNSTNSFNSQKINESFSTEDFLSLPSDSINKDSIKKLLSKDVSDCKSELLLNENKMNVPKNESLVISKKNKTLSNKSFIFSSDDDDEDEQISFKSVEETKTTSSTVNKFSENCLDSEKQESLKNIETDTSYPEATSNSIENRTQSNKLSLFLCGDNEQQEVSCNPMFQNENSKNDRKISDSSLKEIILEKSNSHKDSVDGLFFSRTNSIDETPKKLPGKLSKNAGAFINVKGLLPNSKSSQKPTSQSDSLNENNDESLPKSGTKLFSVEKDRARIQVKRRPPSRKARQANRTSYVDIGHESNLNESSRLFGSTSDLVDYQSSPILNDNNNTDSFGKAQNEIQVPSNNILSAMDEKIDEKLETKRKNILNLFDDDSDPFELSHGEKSRSDIKKKTLDEKEPEFKVELIDNPQPFVEPAINELETESVHKTLPNVKPVKENQVAETINQEKIESNFTTPNTAALAEKSNSLFDNGNLFSPKSKVSSSNIFDSDEDDEVEFDQKFNKKSLAKSKSIFDDDSDEDDLFNTPSKPSASNNYLSSQKPIGTKPSAQNRPTSDGYVKLAAESVAINPLESKED